ncbi:MAG: DUF192 domain-containing protein [Alphaproteobacteria bacterium]|nr:DUF192 domain-containing protein [Alphaproteobacteria bacterium]MDE2042196.1 DUF192 domain-containing protein [Alphaproteobacteria bacterium]MDE2340268.1 DUF192 domain-containing protein [Alphaproteobacteria bacterium]
MRLRDQVLTAVAFAALGIAVPASQAVAQSPNPTLTRIHLTILTHHGRRNFTVEVARTSEEQEFGLMYRTHIPAGTGMIFPEVPPHPVAFWMKNCPIPEDMIFIRPDGRIEHIAQMTHPYDETPLASGGNVSAVLEVAGGETRRLGIRAGDRVQW